MRLNAQQIAVVVANLYQVDASEVAISRRNWCEINSGQQRIYISQSKPSHAGKGKWDYEMFSTVQSETMEEIDRRSDGILLINYVDLRVVRLRSEDVKWLLVHCGREKSGETVYDIVIDFNAKKMPQMRPLKRGAEAAPRAVEIVPLPMTAIREPELKLIGVRDDEISITVVKAQLDSKRLVLHDEVLQVFLAAYGSELLEVWEGSAPSVELEVGVQLSEVNQLLTCSFQQSGPNSLSVWHPIFSELAVSQELAVEVVPRASSEIVQLRLQEDDLNSQGIANFEEGYQEEYPIPELKLAGIEQVNIRTDQVSFEDLLEGSSIFVMPRFQRAFSWNKNNFDALWRDIDPLWYGNEKFQFLGTLVVKDYRTRKGGDAAQHWVIDGQQRITTLYAIIAGLAHVALQNGFSDVAENFAQGLFVYNRSCKKDFGKPSIMPTHNDLKGFTEILENIKACFNGAMLYPKYGDNTLLQNSWVNHMVPQIEKRTRGADGAIERTKLEYLFEIITQKILFVQIDVPSEINPQTVFDRMNTEGVKLKTSDLVRNLLLEPLIEEPDRAEKVFEQYILPFEEKFNFRSGSSNKSKLDDFYFPYALSVGMENITKASMFAELRQRWSQLDPEDVINNLEHYTPPFLALAVSPDKLSETSQLRADHEVFSSITRLAKLPAPSSLYSYLLPLLISYSEGHQNKKNVLSCLNLLESYLVRRGVAGLQSAGFQTLFKGMWKAAGNLADAQHLLSQITTKAGYDFPENDNFQSGLESSEIFRKKSVARFILAEREISLDKNKAHQRFVMENYGTAQLEHIIPQDPSKWEGEVEGWGWNKSEFQSWREANLHTLANLTLLLPYENIETSNLPWSDKRDIYTSKVKNQEPRQIATQYYEKFDSTAYKQREKELVDWALQRWPRDTD